MTNVTQATRQRARGDRAVRVATIDASSHHIPRSWPQRARTHLHGFVPLSSPHNGGGGTLAISMETCSDGTAGTHATTRANIFALFAIYLHYLQYICACGRMCACRTIRARFHRDCHSCNVNWQICLDSCFCAEMQVLILSIEAFYTAPHVTLQVDD